MKAKKSLGQNFLKSNNAIHKIVEAGKISKDDVIIEIGPGRGALTEKLLLEVVTKRATCVIAIEKDTALLLLLKEKFVQYITMKTLILLEGDILDSDLGKIIGNNNYKVIANIPYNITGAILKKFLTAENQPTDMVLMVQHEVAKRIIAHDKKESILSISVKAYGEPYMVIKVPARYFSPAPKVDSAVIGIKNISRKRFSTTITGSEEKFWQIVHAGFAHKRKKLASNLKDVLVDQKDVLKDLQNKRAEELLISNWIELASH